MSSRLHIETFCLGDWQTNCYVLHTDTSDDPQLAGQEKKSNGEKTERDNGEEEGRKCWIVDAGFGSEAMVQYIQSRGLRPQQVVLTHAHVDHIAGLSVIRAQWPDIPIVIHEAEREFLTQPMLNLSIVLAQPLVAPLATGTLSHGQRLELDGLSFEVRHTPGHSPGSVTLYQADAGVALAGDTLFAGSVGRTDFPTSDHGALMESIRTQLYTLSDDTRVLPGHGPETTVGREKQTNPYVRV